MQEAVVWRGLAYAMGQEGVEPVAADPFPESRNTWSGCSRVSTLVSDEPVLSHIDTSSHLAN